MDIVGSLPPAGGAPRLPLPVIVMLSLVQNGVLLAVAILVGMILSARIGLRMPLIQAWTTGAPLDSAARSGGVAPGERTSAARAVVLPGLLTGAAAGAALVAIEALVFFPYLPPAMQPLLAIPLWKRLLGGVVYGGITEEVMMRLFLMSLVAWLCGRWWKTAAGAPAPGAFWLAIILVAVLFGLGHLPVTSLITPLTAPIVARALVLNGIAGVAFGYLFWTRGLEAAMIGHASAHLVLQVPGVMLLTRMT
jgi:membrane protease YdiL (CAAX protease family)